MRDMSVRTRAIDEMMRVSAAKVTWARLSWMQRMNRWIGVGEWRDYAEKRGYKIDLPYAGTIWLSVRTLSQMEVVKVGEWPLNPRPSGVR